MGENCFEFEGKIRNDFSIKLPYLNSCIVPFVSCLDSRSIRGDFVEFWFQRFLSIYKLHVLHVFTCNLAGSKFCPEAGIKGGASGLNACIKLYSRKFYPSMFFETL